MRLDGRGHPVARQPEWPYPVREGRGTSPALRERLRPGNSDSDRRPSRDGAPWHKHWLASPEPFELHQERRLPVRRAMPSHPQRIMSRSTRQSTATAVTITAAALLEGCGSSGSSVINLNQKTTGWFPRISAMKLLRATRPPVLAPENRCRCRASDPATLLAPRSNPSPRRVLRVVVLEVPARCSQLADPQHSPVHLRRKGRAG
jgi:hypothetical protein